jgi:transposase
MASPQIKTIQVGDQTRYRFVVDIGTDPVTGKRRQLSSAATVHRWIREARRRGFLLPPARKGRAA